MQPNTNIHKYINIELLIADKLFMKYFSLFVSMALYYPLAHANYDVNRLLDSYSIAKADTLQAPISEDEIKKMPYTIQVDSFVNEKDAVNLVEELRLQEKEVFYFPAFSRGQIWFKVCVGKFVAKSKAEEYRGSFIKRMDADYSVVISLLDRPSAETRKLASAPAYYYSLQVGAYPTESLVKDNLKTFQSQKDAHYKSALIGGKQMYRIYIGKFSTKKEARSFQKSYSAQNKDVQTFIRHVSTAD
ncbi:MAG: hypothetical protein A2Z20_00355 [Bdellovibrionales bacterium RBG_16_40_8]|nr:MAG: hypothetical protein A2Z20_00355 [Bdellovibrionales bacterium RBG_16_40_8]